MKSKGLLFIGDTRQNSLSLQRRASSTDSRSQDESFQQPPKTLPRSPGNEREWLDACKGGSVKPGGNFEFAGMVTESLLLGDVATRLGQKLNWEPASLKITNSALAQK